MAEGVGAADAAVAPDPSSQGDVVGRDVLEARCALLEQSVRASGHVPAGEIDAVRPGGSENPDTSAHGWLHFLCNLHRMHERGPAVRTKGGGSRWDQTAMDALREALAAAPIPLVLSNGTKVSVHPKSEYALHRLLVNDKALQWCVTRRLALEDVDPHTPESLRALHTAIELQRQLEAEFAAICCAPGAGIGPEDGAAWEVPVPEWTRTLEPYDILAIRRAHIEVNVVRVQEVSERTKQYAEGSGSMPLAAFLGVMAGEMGVQPADLARRWSLGEVFAQALVRWEAQERAKQDAERKADS